MTAGRPARAPRSLRTRLTLTLCAVFVLSGIGVVVAVYLVVDHAVFTAAATFDPADERPAPEGASDLPTGLPTDFPTDLGAHADTELCQDGTMDCIEASEQLEDQFTGQTLMPLGADGEVDEVWVVEGQLQVARATMQALTVWSVVIVLVFAVLASLLTWWVLRRSLRRLEDATAAARQIDAENRTLRLQVTGPDDEIKDLGDTVDEVLDQLAEALDAQSRFVANASHELRTPLATARTALDIPLAQGRFPADLEPAVRAALAANERSTELLAALLVLARSGPGGAEDLTDRFDHTDLADLVRAAVAEQADAADRAEVTVLCEAEPAVVLGDPTLLAQVAVNLVGNAVQHNRPGGRMQVRTGVVAAADEEQGDAPPWVRLEVVNDGDLLDPAEIDRLREPFHRGARSRLAGDGTDRAAGSGLGLSIVDAVVARHGGRLHLTARPEGGLRVRVELPPHPPAGP